MKSSASFILGSISSFAIFLLISSASAQADTYVKGYTKSNGTYVQPHYRSDADSTTSNNWSTKGNQNPYTGSYGTKSNSDYSYGSKTTNSYGTKSSNNDSGFYGSDSDSD